MMTTRQWKDLAELDIANKLRKVKKCINNRLREEERHMYFIPPYDVLVYSEDIPRVVRRRGGRCPRYLSLEIALSL